MFVFVRYVYDVVPILMYGFVVVRHVCCIDEEQNVHLCLFSSSRERSPLIITFILET